MDGLSCLNFISLCKVFSAGQLMYIDFDTKNKTFDTVVPMAYQVRHQIFLKILAYKSCVFMRYSIT